MFRSVLTRLVLAAFLVAVPAAGGGRCPYWVLEGLCGRHCPQVEAYAGTGWCHTHAPSQTPSTDTHQDHAPAPHAPHDHCPACAAAVPLTDRVAAAGLDSDGAGIAQVLVRTLLPLGTRAGCPVAFGRSPNPSPALATLRFAHAFRS